MTYRLSRTPHKFRSVAADTVPNFVALVREKMAKANARAWETFELPADAEVEIEAEHDGYGPRLHIFHDGLEVAMSLRPGTAVKSNPSLLLPQIFRDIQQNDVLKVVWRHAPRGQR